ncbi:MAG TPA: hypothetical protein VFU50_03265 [Terriglobales bacterium]|nr:hypothetical protein [Terriglobales bacterium]
MHWTLQNVVWIFSGLLEVFVCLAMLLRGSWREYRVFWSYLLLEAVRTGVLFSIGTDHSHYRTYFYSYWISELCVCVLGFFVIREIFAKAFSGQLGLKHWGDWIFACSLIALLAVACFSGADAHGDSNRLLAAILVLKWAESFVRLGVLAALSISVLLLGLPWKHHAIGIAAGFAFYGSIELTMLATRLHLGKQANRWVFWAFMFAGIFEKAIWALYFVPRLNTRRFELRVGDSHAAASLLTAQEAADAIWER